MLTGIDHVVIVVENLENATAKYQALGFTVVPGGQHPTGTHNALIGFSDGSYIELLAFQREAPEHRWWYWKERGGGIADVCARTTDMMSDIHRYRGADIEIEDPSPLSRLRPDGYLLKWHLAIPESPITGIFPFLIEDETPREERVPRQINHANKVTGISEVAIAVDNIDSVASSYERISESGADYEIDENHAVQTASFRIGDHSFRILQPSADSSQLTGWLAKQGPSIYSLSLKREAVGARELDMESTQGARLIFV